MKKVFLSLAVVLFFVGVALAGTGLSAKDEKAINSAGLSVYPGAIVIPGEHAMGIGFATSDGVEKVRKWYEDNSPGWAVFDDGEMWILYEGEPGLKPFEIMSKSQVLVGKNGNLPLVHGFEKNVTTEIVIIIPAAQ